MNIAEAHKAATGWLGDRIGIGISHELAQKYFSGSISSVQGMKVKSINIPGLKLGVELSVLSDEEKTKLSFTDDKPRLSVLFWLRVFLKADPQKTFRTLVSQQTDVPLELHVSSDDVVAFIVAEPPDSLMSPVGSPDPELIKDHYGGSETEYLADEATIKVQANVILSEFVSQIPLPDFANYMETFRLSAPLRFDYRPGFFVIYSEKVDVDFGKCIDSTQVRREMEFSYPTIPETVLSAGENDPPARFKTSSEFKHNAPKVMKKNPIDIEAWIYYPKHLSLDIPTGSLPTKVAIKEKKRGSNFFVRWFYQASAGIESARLILDVDAQRAAVDADVSADATGAAVIRIGCIDVASGVAAIDVSSKLNIDIDLEGDTVHNYKDVVLTTKVSLGRMDFDVYAPFPFNLVLEVVMQYVVMMLSNRVVASSAAHFRLPLLRTEEVFAQAKFNYPWISNIHLLESSEMIGFSTD